MALLKTRVTLDTRDNWESWIFIIKSMVIRGKVWEFINPDLPNRPVKPELPDPPKPVEASTASPPNTIFGTLTALEKEIYIMLLSLYKEKRVKLVKQVEAI